MKVIRSWARLLGATSSIQKPIDLITESDSKRRLYNGIMETGASKRTLAKYLYNVIESRVLVHF